MKIAWNDLSTVLAVATQGSLAGGARALGVNHTTVLRRVAALEQRLGLRIFERLPTGYVPTAGGEELIATARQISEAVVALERRLVGRDPQLRGAVRVTTTDSLAASLMPELLARFRAAQPGILIELAVSNAMFNLTRRDADVAIRPALGPRETLIGRRIATIAFAVYASPSCLGDRQIGRDDLPRCPWVVPDDSLVDSSVGRWMQAIFPDVEVTLRADSLLALRHAAAAGLGLAALPCYLGDTSPDLVRVTPPVAEMQTELWLLTHRDLRRSARVRAFLDFAASSLARQRALLEGRREAAHLLSPGRRR